MEPFAVMEQRMTYVPGKGMCLVTQAKKSPIVTPARSGDAQSSVEIKK